MYLSIYKFKINIICLLVILIFVMLNGIPYTSAVLACVAIHELGHIAVLRRFGARISRLEIQPYGLKLGMYGGELSYRRDIAAALGGPLANLAVCAVCLVVMKWVKYDKMLLFAFAANLSYAVLNLVPVRHLDGGRICEGILHGKLPYNRVNIVLGVISAASLAALGAAALFVLMATGYNFSLVLICCYLFYTLHFKPAYSMENT